MTPTRTVIWILDMGVKCPKVSDMATSSKKYDTTIHTQPTDTGEHARVQISWE